MFKENVFLGIGKGRFILENSRNMLAHSNFMENLAETGGIGIFVWVSISYVAFKILILLLNSSHSDLLIKLLSRSLLLSFIGFNVSTLFITMEVDIFYFILGLIVALYSNSCQENDLRLKFGFADFRNIGFVIFVMIFYYHIFLL